jgi:hypothetical protein
MAAIRCLHCRKPIAIDLTNGGWIHTRGEAECLDGYAKALKTKAEPDPKQFRPKGK